MRIAVAASGLGHVSRGIETWAADLGRILSDRGEDVRLCKASGDVESTYERIIACWTRNSAAASLVRRLIPSPLAWRIGLGSGYGIEQASFAPGLFQLLRRERVDVLHVQDPLLALMAQNARRLGLIRAETILAHGTEESPTFQSKIRFLQHLAPWHLEEARVSGFARNSWVSIPNFVDAQKYHPGRVDQLRLELGIPPDAIVVLCVAAIKREHKRIDYLIEEFAALLEAQPNRDVVLVIAGGHESQTDSLVAEGEGRLGRKVIFLVNYPQTKMPDLYRSADIFVLPSLKEMMPIALLEALASGLSCLTHDHPVLRWMIGSGGRAIDMGNSGSLAAALGEWIVDPEKRKIIGARGRARVLEEFDQGAVVDQIILYYKYVIKCNSMDFALGGAR